jgi:hypothetical protein
MSLEAARRNPANFKSFESSATVNFIATDAAEEWRVVRLDAGYEVSSNGRVRNAKTKVALKPWRAGAGYLYMQLWRSRKKIGIHRLVALAFLGEPPSARHEVAHNDGNPKNNRAHNLRWATHAENQADIRKHGTGYYHGWRGESHPTAKLTDQQVIEIRRRCSDGIATRKAMAAAFGMSVASIDKIMQRKTWAHLS